MANLTTSQAREMALFRYTSALERGDFEVVAAVLAQAEDDPILAQMIREVDEVTAHELEQEWKSARRPLLTIRRGYFRNLIGVAAGIVLIGVVTIAILTLMGPSIGNVFSSTVSSYPGDRVALPPRSPAGQATSAIIEVTPVGGPLPNSEGQTFLPWLEGTPGPGMIAALPTGTPMAAASGMETPPPGTQAPALLQGTPTPPGTQVPASPGPGQPPPDRLIIKNGEIDLLVKNTDAAIDQVTQIATDNGGYVLSSQAAFQGDVKSATITIGVRVEQFETAMRRLRQIAIKVEREIATGQDVSSEYVDLQSRMKNLEATRDRVAALLDEAKTVEQAMAINQQLSDLEGQIEQIKGRMNYLSGRAAYSTITINVFQQIDATPTLTPTATLTPTPTSPWSLDPAIDSATKTQVNLVRGILELVTWLVVVPGPYVLILALAAWAFRWWRRGGGKSP